MHVHIASVDELPSYVAAGVTTVHVQSARETYQKDVIRQRPYLAPAGESGR